jgi:VanZ family protein
MTVSADPGRADLTLGQEDDDLYVRLRRNGSTGVGAPPIVVDDVFADDRWRRLVLRVGGGAATVEVDGAVVAEAGLGDDPLRSWDGSFPLTFGSEVGGCTAGSGRSARATAEAGGITVDHLDPGGYELPSGRLAKPLTNLIVERSDVVLNVLGFLPFGTLFALLRPARRAVVGAAVASLVVSAVMEVGQLVVVTRDPSVLDLALNTLGGALGGVLAAPPSRSADVAPLPVEVSPSRALLLGPADERLLDVEEQVGDLGGAVHRALRRLLQRLVHDRRGVRTELDLHADGHASNHRPATAGRERSRREWAVRPMSGTRPPPRRVVFGAIGYRPTAARDPPRPRTAVEDP